MRGLLFVLVLVVAGLVGLGFYQKWFQVESDGADGKSHITLTVDKDKIREDEKKALDKAKDVGHQAKEKVSGPTEKSKDEADQPARPPQNQL